MAAMFGREHTDALTIINAVRLRPAIDGNIYARRNQVERCFSKLKHTHRLATRYDRTANSFVGFVLISAISLWVGYCGDRT